MGAWSAAWRLPAVTSFGSALPEGYDGAFRTFWQRQLDEPIGNILDLACGNGALTWMFNDLLNRDAICTTIYGVDFADIAPFRVLGRTEQDYPAVRFIANTRLERLPFGDDTVDLATSQYGFEYSDLAASVSEVARVLKPTGRLALVMHDRDGWLVRNATGPLPDYRHILTHVDAPEIILELARLCRSAGAASLDGTAAAEYRLLTARLDDTSRVFTELYRRNPDINPVLAYKSKLNLAFQEANKPLAQREFDLGTFLDEARQTLRRNIARLEDLEAIALDASGRQRLCDLLVGHGFEVADGGPLRYANGQVWGTFLAARLAKG